MKPLRAASPMPAGNEHDGVIVDVMSIDQGTSNHVVIFLVSTVSAADG